MRLIRQQSSELHPDSISLANDQTDSTPDKTQQITTRHDPNFHREGQFKRCQREYLSLCLSVPFLASPCTFVPALLISIPSSKLPPSRKLPCYLRQIPSLKESPRQPYLFPFSGNSKKRFFFHPFLF